MTLNPPALPSIHIGTSMGSVSDWLRRITVRVSNHTQGHWPAHSHGSGVIWRSDGLIVTNAHVARGRNFIVQFQDGRQTKGFGLLPVIHRSTSLLSPSISADLPAANPTAPWTRHSRSHFARYQGSSALANCSSRSVIPSMPKER